MSDFQGEKKLVLEFFDEINKANVDALSNVVSKYTSENLK